MYYNRNVTALIALICLLPWANNTSTIHMSNCYNGNLVNNNNIYQTQKVFDIFFVTGTLAGIFLSLVPGIITVLSDKCVAK